MRQRSFLLAGFLLMAMAAFSQNKKYIDSLNYAVAAAMKTADSLKKTSSVNPGPHDTLHRVLYSTTVTSDTIRKRVDSSSSKAAVKTPDPEKKVDNTPPKHDKRWFISPMLKFQAQEFGMLEKNRMMELSDEEKLTIEDKVNLSLAASAYKNFGGHLSMSLDLGVSRGAITCNECQVSAARVKRFNGLLNTTMYYHLLDGRSKLQPFLAAGFNALVGKGTYFSAPVGVGVKFTSKKLMIEAQTAYGYSVSSNIANTMMYSMGIYIPLKRKKDEEKKEEQKDKKEKDTIFVNITNITNNYYIINNDSLNKAKADSVTKSRSRKPGYSGNTSLNPTDTILDADDPMNLPSAVKNIIYFYYDQYYLTSSAFGIADQVVTRMKDNPKLFVHLKGYTDLAGSEQYNIPLSKKRAQMVFDYFNSRGISSERMTVSSYGKNNPIVNSNDPQSAWQNRRCEIVLYEKD